ncbi:MAG: hypothetical protein VCF24_00085, partial [Candidatus Latescibacterota bacterium]
QSRILAGVITIPKSIKNQHIVGGLRFLGLQVLNIESNPKTALTTLTPTAWPSCPLKRHRLLLACL